MIKTNTTLLKILCISLIACASIVLFACAPGARQENNITLDSPANLHFDYESNTFKWDAVERATIYSVSFGQLAVQQTSNTYLAIPATLDFFDSGIKEFSVMAHNTSEASYKSILQYTICFVDKEIDADVRIEDDCLVWDEFKTNQDSSYIALITGDDVNYPEIGLVNGMEFDAYKHYSNGLTSVRIRAGAQRPVYQSTTDTGTSPTFNYYDTLISESFEYNVDTLNTPINLSLDKEGYLSWDAVDKAMVYKISIYKDDFKIPYDWGTEHHLSFPMDFPTYDIGGIIWTNTISTTSASSKSMGNGSYNFRVYATTNIIDYVEGVPTIYCDSERSLSSDTYNIQFLDLPDIVVTTESDYYSWEAAPDISYGYWIQRGDKQTFSSLSASGTITFEQIRQNIDFAVQQGYIDSEGETTILLRSSLSNFDYCEESDILYMYYHGYSQPIVINWL